VPGILEDLRTRRLGVLAALQTAEGVEREAATQALADLDQQLAGFGESGQLVITQTDEAVKP
jgi:hypothetical protein